MKRLAGCALVCVLAVSFFAPTSVVEAESYPTIDGRFSGTGAIAGGQALNLTVAGRGGVPATGVDAVAINVTATNPSLSSYLTVWPTGSAKPTASNLNFIAGQTTPNMVIAKIGNGGQISLYNNAGIVHAIVDVLGWFPTGGSYTGLSPARLLDTRPGSPTVDSRFSGGGTLGQTGTIAVKVTGRGGVPEGGVGAVAVNVTVTNPSSTSYLAVWPTGSPQPTASSLNFTADQTTANMVIAKVGEGGQISLFNNSGTVDVIVDVLGWFPVGGSYTGLTPARVLDTRVSGGIIGAGGTINVLALGQGGVPSSGVGAVAVNVTATNSTSSSYLTVWPSGAPRPTASNLNFNAGQSTPNMVIAGVGIGGQISIFNNAGTVDVIVDVLGWFPTGGSYNELTPARLLDSRVAVGTPPIPTIPTVPPTTNPPSNPVYSPGTYAVNTQIPPGRYMAVHANASCYWERVSGFGGSIGEIIANDISGFTGRVIVDLLASDVGFEFDGDCGTFTLYSPPPAPAANIVPGAHVVGKDISPGTYVTNAAEYCYWERLTGFSGSLDQIIANDFISAAGQVIVTITVTDVGFRSDDECGTWTRM